MTYWKNNKVYILVLASTVIYLAMCFCFPTPSICSIRGFSLWPWNFQPPTGRETWHQRLGDDMAKRSVGHKFTDVKSAFSSDKNWLEMNIIQGGIFVDYGRIPKSTTKNISLWLFEINSNYKVELFVEDEIVVGIRYN